jgi:hypothetical protein
MRNYQEGHLTAKAQRTQRGKAATKFWIFDFGFWIEEEKPYPNHNPMTKLDFSKTHRENRDRISRI